VAAGTEDLLHLRVVEVVRRGDVNDLDPLVTEKLVQRGVRLRKSRRSASI
jgi:hypothetical protein